MRRLLDYFDRIYVINLPERIDRRQEIAVQLARIGLSFDQSRVTLFRAIRPADEAGFPSIGARGCFLSHLQILRDAERQRLNTILIFEDDLDFAPDIVSRLLKVIELLSLLSWQIFYGGYEIEDLALNSCRGLISVNAEVSVRTTHFVGLQGKAIRGLADFMATLTTRPRGDPRGGPMHVDGAYNWYRRLNPQAPTVVAVPVLGVQRSSRTDVHALKWYDSIALVRDVAQRLRQTKNAIRRSLRNNSP